MKHQAETITPTPRAMPVFERCPGCNTCGWLCRRAAHPVRPVELAPSGGPFLRAKRRVARGFGQVRRVKLR